MDALIRLPGSLDTDRPGVEWVLEDFFDAGLKHRAAPRTRQTAAVHFVWKRPKGVFATGVELEHGAYQRTFDWTDGLGFALPMIEIAKWSFKGIQALLQTHVEPLLGLFPEIADVVSGD